VIPEWIVPKGQIGQYSNDIGHGPVIDIAVDEAVGFMGRGRMKNKSIGKVFDILDLDIGENGPVIPHEGVMQTIAVGCKTEAG
jgi:hypothetical protein